jgi:hypothetical protein
MKHLLNRQGILISFMLLTAALSFLAVYAGNPAAKNNESLWDKQLNSLNYLVIRTSSINLINGLMLSPEQAEALLVMSRRIESSGLPLPDHQAYASADLIPVAQTFLVLCGLLERGEAITDSLADAVFNVRLKESEIIRLSLLGTMQPSYHGEGCEECHAPPQKFPQNKFLSERLAAVDAEKRRKTDEAHVKALFGEQGTWLLWEMKSRVDSLLTEEQRYVFSSFRCCLLPPEDVSDPGLIGQSFVTNEWIDYFRGIRKISDEYWPYYSHYYIYPLEQLLLARLPSIAPRDKKKLLDKAGKVIEQARSLTKVDFELQKEELCVKLSEALNVDLFNGEAARSGDERKFMAAMFLLFPGSSNMYQRIISNAVKE